VGIWTAGLYPWSSLLGRVSVTALSPGARDFLTGIIYPFSPWGEGLTGAGLDRLVLVVGQLPG
jgi:hypothetical protein